MHFARHRIVKLSASYLHWAPCGWSSSSADTAAPSSCPSCSGSHTDEYPPALPRQPGTPCCCPAWLLSPCPQGTGALPGTESCSKGPGCTCRSPGCSLPILAELLAQTRGLEILENHWPRTQTKLRDHPRSSLPHLGREEEEIRGDNEVWMNGILSLYVCECVCKCNTS